MYPRTIIYGCHLITRACQKFGRLYGLDSGFLDLLMHKFNKYPASRIRLMHAQIIKDLQVGKQIIHCLIFQRKASMGKNWNRDLNWTIFRFPSLEGLLTCCKTKFGPCWAHNHMFIKWAQSLAMYSPPFLSQIEVNQKLQSYNQHV